MNKKKDNVLNANTKMFLFARWISINYADVRFDKKGKINEDRRFNHAEAISVLNLADGNWWKTQLEYFNKNVYPEYLKNGSFIATKRFLDTEEIGEDDIIIKL